MNTFGKLFQVSIYGASHEEQIGVLVDGMPAGIKLNLNALHSDLSKRRPGSLGTTKRIENDELSITSGIFNGYTTGAPIHIAIKNENVQSKDYDHIINHPRPGHADFVMKKKYKGFADHRGGGIFSGRLTSGVVIAGSLAKHLLPFKFSNELIQVGTLTNMEELDNYLSSIKDLNDTVGGIVKIVVKDMFIGLGEPFFYKAESILGQLLFSIPSVKAVSFGSAYRDFNLLGSVFNESILDSLGKQKNNYAGGIHGGITNGNDLEIYCFVKPTPSLGKEVNTFSYKTNDIEPLLIGGRHDVAHIRRIGIVLESAVAVGLADLYLINK